ncbi:hypothetical protein AN619_18450 [Thermotalea metallivorans]|uniref:Uncharacterized protein n=1 Tax=Thermotalea metallivorans TaxID=520762 RepID=A0A140L405_9FIRM|nr:hypothetical protein AN619_18450 [Thermotalea metallivorans]
MLYLRRARREVYKILVEKIEKNYFYNHHCFLLSRGNGDGFDVYVGKRRRVLWKYKREKVNFCRKELLKQLSIHMNLILGKQYDAWKLYKQRSQ